MTGKPILVTGSHRSGTTWVGQMIASAHEVAYVQEPFHIKSNRTAGSGKKFDDWFTYITLENEDDFYQPLKKTLELRFDIFTAIQQNLTFSQHLKKHIKKYLQFMSYRLLGKRALIKDPIAVFSDEWLSKRFDMHVIVLIRHPLALAGNLKKKGWSHPFAHFLHQPLLMKDHLGPFYEEIVEYAERPPGIIDQACLLWQIIYSMVHKYQESHDDWIFLGHEDISSNPIPYFRVLFASLGLEFTPRIQAIIKDNTDSSNPQEPRQGVSTLKRNSESNILTWKHRLTNSEIIHIREQVEDVSKYFYTDNDWR